MNCYYSDERLVTELYHILEQNANIETLYIQLTNNFNFEIFGKLKNLRHLVIGATEPDDIIKIIPFLKMHGVTKLQIEILFEHYEDMSDDSDEVPDDSDEEMPMVLNESLKRLAETVTLKELSLKEQPNQFFSNLSTSTIRALHFFELTSLHLQDYLDYDRRYEIIANVQPNLTNLDLHFWRSGANKQLVATVFLIKNLKKLVKFRVYLLPRARKQFLDENLFIGILQEESTERPTLTVKFYDDHDDANRNVEVKFFFKERMHKVTIFPLKESFLLIDHENYNRPWCVNDLESEYSL